MAPSTMPGAQVGPGMEGRSPKSRLEWRTHRRFSKMGFVDDSDNSDFCAVWEENLLKIGYKENWT